MVPRKRCDESTVTRYTCQLHGLFERPAAAVPRSQPALLIADDVFRLEKAVQGLPEQALWTYCQLWDHLLTHILGSAADSRRNQRAILTSPDQSGGRCLSESQDRAPDPCKKGAIKLTWSLAEPVHVVWVVLNLHSSRRRTCIRQYRVHYKGG